MSNIVSSQAADHSKYGGVIPELASRLHQQSIVPIVELALEKAGIQMNTLTAIACTRGPGLMGALLVGYNFAKGLSLALSIPLIGVDHIQAHILAHFIEEPKPDFPFLCLVVSGGHTSLYHCVSPLELNVIGTTLDDAAGEAFDKTAKMLGLDYPGGPQVDLWARKGTRAKYAFPIPSVPGYNFSFSGLKTAILYFLQENVLKEKDFRENNMADICLSVQDTIIKIVLQKLEKAALDLGITNIALAGGVSANSGLRLAVQELCENRNWKAFIPDFQYCTDNAAMIACAAAFNFRQGRADRLNDAPYSRGNQTN